jgi:hypothetical protein
LLFLLRMHEVIRSTNILAILCMVNGQCCNQLFNLEHILSCCAFFYYLCLFFLLEHILTYLYILSILLVTCTMIITSCLVIFFLFCGRLTGQTWILLFHCKGAPKDKELIELEIDRGDIFTTCYF